jgi:hypothetical protein
MRRSVIKGFTLVALIGASACALPAYSGRAPGNMVTGTVSSVSSNQIVVDGKSYSVKVQGPAFRQLQQVQLGEAVDLLLNGSPKSAGSQVIAIHVHEKQN